MHTVGLELGRYTNRFATLAAAIFLHSPTLRWRENRLRTRASHAAGPRSVVHRPDPRASFVRKFFFIPFSLIVPYLSFRSFIYPFEFPKYISRENFAQRSYYGTLGKDYSGRNCSHLVQLMDIFEAPFYFLSFFFFFFTHYNPLFIYPRAFSPNDSSPECQMLLVWEPRVYA